MIFIEVFALSFYFPIHKVSFIFAVISVEKFPKSMFFPMHKFSFKFVGAYQLNTLPMGLAMFPIPLIGKWALKVG